MGAGKVAPAPLSCLPLPPLPAVTALLPPQAAAATATARLRATRPSSRRVRNFPFRSNECLLRRTAATGLDPGCLGDAVVAAGGGAARPARGARRGDRGDRGAGGEPGRG